MIYHITSKSLWEYALNYHFYKHPSLKTEGFIHCSTLIQLPTTLKRHFSGTKEVIVLEIIEKKVSEILKWEAATDGELFPHIYGKISVGVIQNQFIWAENAEGEWEKVD